MRRRTVVSVTVLVVVLAGITAVVALRTTGATRPDAVPSTTATPITRSQAGRRLPPLHAELERFDDFGGLWLGDDGRVDVAVVGMASNRLRSAVRDGLPAHTPVRYVRVEHSYAQLTAAYGRFSGSVLDEHDVFSVGIDERRNAVTVGVTDTSAEAAVRHVVPDDDLFRFEVGTAPTAAADER